MVGSKDCKCGSGHEWVVFSTALLYRCLMVQCVKCGDRGVVEDPSSEEWAEAFHAPDCPYRWHDGARVRVTGGGEPSVTRSMLMEKKEYDLDFAAKQWEEIECLGFDGFQPTRGEPLLRSQWLAIADLALGKAQRIEEGEFGGDIGQTADDDACWAAELREIAADILCEFKPADGKV